MTSAVDEERAGDGAVAPGDVERSAIRQGEVVVAERIAPCGEAADAERKALDEPRRAAQAGDRIGARALERHLYRIDDHRARVTAQARTRVAGQMRGHDFPRARRPAPQLVHQRVQRPYEVAQHADHGVTRRTIASAAR